jgi:hypothetical protein
MPARSFPLRLPRLATARTASVRWMGPVALALIASTAWAIDLDVSTQKVESALKLARGTEAARAAFHKAYMFTLTDPTVESVEVITEWRRLVKIAEARTAEGDHFFSSDTRAAEEAIRSWRRKVSVVVRLRFHPQNAYVLAPPIEVELTGLSGAVPRLDQRIDTLFALASGRSREQLPVVGAMVEAVFDAVAVGQTSRTVVVRLQSKDLASVAIDFGLLN